MEEEKSGLIIGPVGPVAVELQRARPPLHSAAICLGHADVLTTMILAAGSQHRRAPGCHGLILSPQTHWKAVDAMRRDLSIWGLRAGVCVHSASAQWMDELGPIRWAVTPRRKQRGSGPFYAGGSSAFGKRTPSHRIWGALGF